MTKKNVKPATTAKEAVKKVEAKVEETKKAVETAKTAEAAKVEKTVKAVETKVEETKKAVTTEAAKVETAVEKKKTAAKTTVKKAAAKVAPAKPEIILQYQNNEADVTKLEEKVKAQFVAEGHKAGTIKTMTVYVKPEDYSAYYVINGKYSGRVDLF